MKDLRDDSSVTQWGGGGDVRFRLFQHYEYVGSKPISVMRGAGVKLPEKMLEI